MMRRQICTLLGACFVFCSSAQAGLIKDGIWQIKQGDTLKSILKQSLPDQPLRQKRLKRLAPRINKAAFDTKGRLIVGQKLRLPGVKMTQDKVTPDSPQIGRVLITNGPTIAQAPDGKRRALKRGSAINKGDTIQTKNARAQIRFSDGSLLALRPNTDFKVVTYNFSGKQDGSEKGVYSLIKGGFRTISGAIGSVNKDTYQIRTPVATIGIRGTHYGITLCASGSCADRGLKDGLYGGVVDGSISTTNDAGTSIFDNDEYFLISDLASLAQKLLAPPGIIFDDPASSPQQPDQQDTKKEKSPTQKKAEELARQLLASKKPDFDGTLDSALARDLVTRIREALGELTSSTTLTHPTLPGSPAANGTVVGFSFMGSKPNPLNPSNPDVDDLAFSILQNGNTQRINVGAAGGAPSTLLGLSYEETLADGINSIASINTTGGTIGDTGANSTLGFIWGRWSQTPAQADILNVSVNATPQTGIHFALADANKVLTSQNALTSAATRVGLSSTVTMSQVGGILPTNFSGVQASGGSSSLNLNFIANTADFSINTTFGLDNYSLSGSNIPFASIVPIGSSASLTGSCTGSTGSTCENTISLTGKASFVFTDNGLPSGSGGALGAAVNYAGEGTHSNGTAVGFAGNEIYQSP